MRSSPATFRRFSFYLFFVIIISAREDYSHACSSTLHSFSAKSEISECDGFRKNDANDNGVPC